MEIIKIVVLVIICAVICIILKQVRPEIVPFVEVSAIIFVTAFVINGLKNVLDSVSELAGNIAVIDEGYLFLLIKVLGVAIVTKTGADICRDGGSSALATNIELAGKVIIFAMSFSLVKIIAELAQGLLS